MWLAWRHGACLVPAPRSLVRSGMDLGPWLVANDVTVVSTVPTLVALWPTDALDDVRLLILGGEACPPELGARLATPEREVWNTYGPTEATVVACGARLTGEPPVRIGLPLDGWDLAVVDASGLASRRRAGRADHRRSRSGALPRRGEGRREVRGDADASDGTGPTAAATSSSREPGPGLQGRADDQVKIGGRRIELGEIDSALLALPGVSGAAAAVGRSDAGNRLLVGYVTAAEGFELEPALSSCAHDARGDGAEDRRGRTCRPARPGRSTGRRCRGPARPGAPAARRSCPGTVGWVAGHYAAILGAAPAGEEDFFDLGGGSLTAAQLVSRLRERFPEVTVADVYEHPVLADLAATLDAMAAPSSATRRRRGSGR